MAVVVGILVNSAVTVLSFVILTVQSPEPEHEPNHPMNWTFPLGNADTTTEVP
jgi:hypothetical protein